MIINHYFPCKKITLYNSKKKTESWLFPAVIFHVDDENLLSFVR